MLQIFQKKMFAKVALGKQHSSDLVATVHEKVLHPHIAHQNISEADVYEVSLPEDGTNISAPNLDTSMVQDAGTENSISSDLHNILRDFKLRVWKGDHKGITEIHPNLQMFAVRTSSLSYYSNCSSPFRKKLSW